LRLIQIGQVSFSAPEKRLVKKSVFMGKWFLWPTANFQRIWTSSNEVIDMAHSLDTLLASEKPDVVKRAKAKAEGVLLKIHLAEVRVLLQKTQNDMAEAMGVTQPTIASLEKLGKDLKLSSVKRYVEGAGAKVSLDIELPDGTRHAIPL